MSNVLFGFSTIWLFVYGLLKLKTVFMSNSAIVIKLSSSKSLLSTLSTAAILTFVNPHVYLDTLVLIGTVSQQFSFENKIAYVFGAILASFTFFFCLAYGAKQFSPMLKKATAWKIIDLIIAIIMFLIAINLALNTNWSSILTKT